MLMPHVLSENNRSSYIRRTSIGELTNETLRAYGEIHPKKEYSIKKGIEYLFTPEGMGLI